MRTERENQSERSHGNEIRDHLRLWTVLDSTFQLQSNLVNLLQACPNQQHVSWKQRAERKANLSNIFVLKVTNMKQNVAHNSIFFPYSPFLFLLQNWPQLNMLIVMVPHYNHCFCEKGKCRNRFVLPFFSLSTAKNETRTQSKSMLHLNKIWFNS